MTAKRFIIAAILLGVLITACKTNINVTPVPSRTTYEPKEIIQYYLPKTRLGVRLPIVKTVKSEGLLKKLDRADPGAFKVVQTYFAVKYGLELKATAGGTTYAMKGKVELVPYAIKDTTKHYSIRYNRKKCKSCSTSFELNEQGILKTGAFAQENQVVELVLKLLDVTANLAMKSSLGDSYQQPGDKEQPTELDLLLKESEKQLKELRRKKANASMITKKENAIAYIRRIMNIDKNLQVLHTKKTDLIGSSTFRTESTTLYDAYIRDLDKQIKLFLDEMNGKSNPSTDWYYFDLGPDGTHVVSTPSSTFQFRLDLLYLYKDRAPVVQTGSVDKTTLKGTFETIAVDIAFQKQDYNLLKKVYAAGGTKKMPVVDSAGGKSKNFLYYNVPARTNVTLLKAGKVINTYKNQEQKSGSPGLTVYFPQFGIVKALPPEFGECTVELFEDVGAIKKLSYKSRAIITGDEITGAGATADSLYSAYKSIFKSEPAQETAEEETTSEQTIHIYWHDGSTATPK